MDEDAPFIQRCLQLAQLAQGDVSPNPMVGALLVHKGRIIGEGYHERYGGPHAEVRAIEAALKRFSESVLQESTLYVSLEPCSHHGKTPPCADLIIRHNIPRVVIATQDPFPAVQGAGIERLRNAGIQVTTGILEEEARFVNRRFFTRIEKQRPYFILKWAQTQNGYMAPLRGQEWISGPQAQILNHRWRTEEDAILVGKNTVMSDNPRLNAREWKGKSPIRLILDRRLDIPDTYHIFDQKEDTIIFTEKQGENRKNLRYVSMESFDFYLAETLAYQCYLFDIQSVIVEGGKQTLELFLKAGIVDEIRIFRSPRIWETGLKAPEINRYADRKYPVGADTLELYYL